MQCIECLKQSTYAYKAQFHFKIESKIHNNKMISSKQRSSTVQIKHENKMIIVLEVDILEI